MRKHALMVGRKKNIFLVGHGRRFVHLNKTGFGSGQRRIDNSEPVISTITISNSSTSSQSYRIAVQKFGETLASKHFIAFDHPISATQMETLTLGITLGRQDKIIVQSDSDRVVFSAFGSENTL
jgi:regulator of extracellular matrix RemA (YlzA/DUF370 family)